MSAGAIGGTRTTGATEAIADFAATLRYESLPADVSHQAKRIILDTLACAIAARPYEAARITRDVLLQLGGRAESSVVGESELTSPATAAFVNAEYANLLDLDDDLLNNTHFANTSVFAPLALAEARGRSGRDLITAVVAAYEINARVTLALTPIVEVRGEWPNHSLIRRDAFGMGCTALGAAAGCGSLVELSPDAMRHALGVAGYSAPVPSSGKNARNRYLHMNKYSAYGQIAQNAVVAALLAEQGFTGDIDVLDGEFGFWRMVGATSCDWDILDGGLGTLWWSLQNTFKVYPACGWNRQPIEAARAVMQKHGLDAVDITAISVDVHPAAARDPLWTETSPSDYLATQMSIPYSVAMAMLDVPGPDWQKQETIDRPDVRRVLGLIEMGVEPLAERAYYDQLREGIRRIRRLPARVTVEAGGERYSEFAEYAQGDPYVAETLLSDDDITAKLVEYGRDSADEQLLHGVADAVWRLDELDDVRELTRLLRLDPR